MINLEHKSTDTSSPFFGDYNGIGRLDLNYDSTFKKLAEIDEANFWGLNLVSCSQDRWDEFPPEALSKFQKNLGYQTIMDSLVPDVFNLLATIAQDPWLSYLYSRIHTMEKVHAFSYSSGVSQAFGAKAEEFLDIIHTDSKIKNRVTNEIEVAAKFMPAVYAGFTESDDNKKLLLEVLSRVLLLEGVKFPFSFFTSWTLNKAYNNCAQGFSQLLIKISIDELQVHTTIGQLLLKRLRKDKKFKQIFDSGWFDEMFTEMVKQTVESEIEWSDYLLEDGETLGFNAEINEHFIKYWADKWHTSIVGTSLFNLKKNDVEIWFDDYRNLNSKNSALQEIDSITYQKNTVVNDLYKFDEPAAHLGV